MKLSRSALKSIHNSNLLLPSEQIFSLPEKVLQFGTGVLLRGLPDYFIDKANRQGLFNGRIVMVKSTAQGDTRAYHQQDNLYTHLIRGVSGDTHIEENIINSSISRVLNASSQWQELLDCAANTQIRIIISNTTEVGIQLVNEPVLNRVPASFPGKLLAFLHERYIRTGGDFESGLIIIPTELLPENGTRLKLILNDLAEFNHFDTDFLIWLNGANHFCNSLVDRIVPGKPAPAMSAELEEGLGFSDDLMIMSEEYRLWAIEGDEEVKSVLSFAAADPGVIIEPDITVYRELKLRLLNGTHTLSSGIAVLAGIETVGAAMKDPDLSAYIKNVMFNEISPGIPYPLNSGAAADFGNAVLDRFRNPAINHAWINITVQYTSKIRARILPVLKTYAEKQNSTPPLIAMGFAAWILFMKSSQDQDGTYYGNMNGLTYRIQDDQAKHLSLLWENYGSDGIVNAVLGDVSLWSEDLTAIPGFASLVQRFFEELQTNGIRKTLQMISGKN